MQQLFIFVTFSLLITSIFNSLYSSFICPNKINPPHDIQINNSYSLHPEFNNRVFSTINVHNRVFIKEPIPVTRQNYYSSKNYCPSNFIIPTIEFYESLISDLGDKAYSILTDKDGFNLTENVYYIIDNRTRTEDYYYYYYYLFLKKGKIVIEYIENSKIVGQNLNIKCVFIAPTVNIKYPNYEKDIEYNSIITIYPDSNYFNGCLWRIKEKTYNSSSITFKFDKSGRYKVEFWGHFINGEIVYLCEFFYVKKKQISNNQQYDDSIIKVIETNFTMRYTKFIHFTTGNCHVAPRFDGGYYVALMDDINYLHILSFDEKDNLIKDFNTTENAEVFDITATDYGFVYYACDYLSSYHSYLKLYNKNYELINTVEVMNNKKEDDKTKDSNISKQVIRYNRNGYPISELRFIYSPEGGKLAYSRGRIFLIFSHSSYFRDDGVHNGDTTITFNDLLKDLDFGDTWGASHSLIQTAIFDDYNFWTAVLSDAHPEGIKIEYTSKRNISYDINQYDSVNKKYNRRIYKDNNDLAGYIKGYRNGKADGVLGGLIFLEKLELFCLIYAKKPNYSNDSNNNKTIIYVSTWKYSISNDSIYNNKTEIIKVFSKNEDIRIRGGKLGEDKIFIMYTQSDEKGLNPKVFIIELPNFKNHKVKDAYIKDIIMNTCEDLRTFADGVLIWAASNEKGKLVINKIGKSKLNKSFDDISEILTKEDLINYEKEINKTNEDNNNNDTNNTNDNNDSFSFITKLFIGLAIILGIIILFIVILIICKIVKKEKSLEFNVNNLKGNLMTID